MMWLAAPASPTPPRSTRGSTSCASAPRATSRRIRCLRGRARRSTGQFRATLRASGLWMTRQSSSRIQWMTRCSARAGDALSTTGGRAAAATTKLPAELLDDPVLQRARAMLAAAAAPPPAPVPTEVVVVGRRT